MKAHRIPPGLFLTTIKNVDCLLLRSTFAKKLKASVIFLIHSKKVRYQSFIFWTSSANPVCNIWRQLTTFICSSTIAPKLQPISCSLFRDKQSNSHFCCICVSMKQHLSTIFFHRGLEPRTVATHGQCVRRSAN